MTNGKPKEVCGCGEKFKNRAVGTLSIVLIILSSIMIVGMIILVILIYQIFGSIQGLLEAIQTLDLQTMFEEIIAGQMGGA